MLSTLRNKYQRAFQAPLQELMHFPGPLCSGTWVPLSLWWIYPSNSPVSFPRLCKRAGAEERGEFIFPSPKLALSLLGHPFSPWAPNPVCSIMIPFILHSGVTQLHNNTGGSCKLKLLFPGRVMFVLIHVLICIQWKQRKSSVTCFDSDSQGFVVLGYVSPMAFK